MVLHANAALSLKKRLLLCERVVEQEWTLTKAAEAAEVSVRTARKWVRRYRAEGEAGLGDRPSTPTRQPTRTSEDRVQAIAALRRLRMTGAQIAELLEPEFRSSWANDEAGIPRGDWACGLCAACAACAYTLRGASGCRAGQAGAMRPKRGGSGTSSWVCSSRWRAVSSVVWVNSPSWLRKWPWRIWPSSARTVRQVSSVRVSATRMITSARKQISTCARMRLSLRWNTGRSASVRLRSRNERSASSSCL